MPSVKEQHSVCATEEPVGGPVELFLLCAKEWFGGGFKNDCFANLVWVQVSFWTGVFGPRTLS